MKKHSFAGGNIYEFTQLAIIKRRAVEGLPLNNFRKLIVIVFVKCGGDS